MNLGRLSSSRIITLIRSVFSWRRRDAGLPSAEWALVSLEGGAFSSRSDPVPL